MKQVISLDIGQQHYSFCVVDFETTPPRILHLCNTLLGDPRAAPTSTLIDRLVQYWETSPLSPDHVIIQQQTRGGPLPMALSFATYTYFRTKGIPVFMASPISKYTAWKRYMPSMTWDQATEIPAHYHPRRRYSIKLAMRICDELGWTGTAVDEHTAPALLTAFTFLPTQDSPAR